ncbi:hypothetical protein Fcan01_16006 [Folsomia candida]|uniref:Ionotropic glutamate receptor C-terminal domain-containing protein n=1 Tax=Folsomia candida TaxID=158441 RepID=A0A226DWE5_FOLCA|nr:hypothetical protein Fcan01_16006 [Folsomia candida]
MGKFIITVVLVLFLTFVSPSNTKFTDFKLDSILLRLNSSCQYFVIHHGLRSEQVSTALLLLAEKKGYLILKLPLIYPNLVADQTNLGINPNYGIFNKVSKSDLPCFITVHLIQKSDTIWGNLKQTRYTAQTSWRSRVDYLLENYMVPLLYSKSTQHYYESYRHSTINLPLLLQVFINTNPGSRDAMLKNYQIFKLLAWVLINDQKQTWYRICISSFSLRATPMRKEAKFYPIVEFLIAPTDLLFHPGAANVLGMAGDYSNAVACLSQNSGPFKLVRESKLKPYAYLFFAMVCQGNYSHSSIAHLRSKTIPKRRGSSTTYIEKISANIDHFKQHGRMDFSLTDHDGFSFLTCYSRQADLSFKAFLQPFQPPLWIGLITTTFCLAVYLVLILRFKFGQTYPSALSFSQFFIVSTLFEKPIPVVSSQVRDSIQFRLVVGVWLVLFVNFTNSYLSLSITSLSAPLGTKSVTLLAHTAKHESY